MIVDWHTHWIPPGLAAALRARSRNPRIEHAAGARRLRYFGSPLPFPAVYDDIDARLAWNRAAGIDHQVLSLPGLFGVDSLPVDDALPLVASFNQATAALARARPDDFSGLAALPLADIGAAVRELERVLGEGVLIGAILPVDAFLSHADAKAWAPLFAVAQRFGAHVFVHPGPLPAGSSDDGAAASGAAVPLDNASYRNGAQHLQSRISSAAITLAFTDFLDPYPDVTVQVANLGGTLPFILERFDAIDLRDRGAIAERTRLRRIFVDTASLGAGAITLAARVFGADRLVLGTDVPIFDAALPIDGVRGSGLAKAEQDAVLAGGHLRDPRRRRPS